MDSRRPRSMTDLAKRRSRSTFDTPPPFLPPRKPSVSHMRRSIGPPSTAIYSVRTVSPASSTDSSQPNSLPSIPDAALSNEASDQHWQAPGLRHGLPVESNFLPRNPRLQALKGEPQQQQQRKSLMPTTVQGSPMRRHSSLRVYRRPSDDDEVHLTVHPTLLASAHSEPCLRSDQARPHSHPPARPLTRHEGRESRIIDDPWKHLPLPAAIPIARPLLPPPRASFQRLSSLDNLISYREEKAQWKRESSLLQFEVIDPDVLPAADLDRAPTPANEERTSEASDDTTLSSRGESSPPTSLKRRNIFRSFAAEVGFCFTIAMTQFLGEYLISGFAIALPELFYRNDLVRIGPGTLGMFWPASLLSLILSATLLIFARLADIYGGYGIFMMGLIWLGTWTLIPGFFASVIILDVSRAMQGLAIAALMPSTFVMASSFYEAGPRKNIVLGLYSGCAPLGFFAGFLTAGALPKSHVQWYLWIPSILAFVAAVIAYLTVPHDWTDRKQLGLKMDWLGASLITAGLILVSYALAYEPDASLLDRSRNGFSFPTAYGPFVAGMLCLVAAVWVEGWYAECPLLPFDFFQPKSTLAVCLAGLCFYASYGVWLYESASYLQSPTGVTKYPFGLHGIELAVWYTPTAVGGLVLCVVGASLLHIVRMELLLLVSGLAWIGAPLLLALCPLPLNYWAVVMPSMLCATLGIDLTYTISLVRFSSTQPKRYQGLCGAICSMLVNLAISFSLPISEIIEDAAAAAASVSCLNIPHGQQFMACADRAINWSYKAMFLYAAASAGFGFIVCVLFVRFPRVAVVEKPADEERPRENSSESPTLASGGDGEKSELLRDADG